MVRYIHEFSHWGALQRAKKMRPERKWKQKRAVNPAKTATARVRQAHVDEPRGSERHERSG